MLKLVSKAQAAINAQVAQATTQGQTIPQEQVTAALDQAKEQVAPFMTSGLGIAHLALGFLVMALVTSLGGPTGPALNQLVTWDHVSFMLSFQNQFLVSTKAIQNGGTLGYQ